ncbi:hypothetical protein [Actinacidiphila yeochonensis]|uniref:hypothetical protein n=1 Tax=Actinacidiphila yeochonensis TaxID=89050 RepID=UPI0012FEE949|nr:hypothetical protein [Actinacidiphila yeochonensis]
MYNARNQYIASRPTPDARSCINRHIYLAADWYAWRLSGLESGTSERDIYLATGWYQWQDCLTYSSPGDYYQTSQLDPDDPAYETASQFNWDYSTGRTYYWGSWMIPA